MDNESVAVVDALDVRASDINQPMDSSPLSLPDDGMCALHKTDDNAGDAMVQARDPVLNLTSNVDVSNQCETIGGFPVHEAASLFPLVVGVEFEELIHSIHQNGQRSPVVLHQGKLLEGRNRTRAVERLRAQGVAIELKTVEWNPRPGESAAQFVADANLLRRHLTDDQRLQIAAGLLPMIEAETGAAQKASRIQPGQVLNPTGRNGTSADRKAEAISLPPSDNKARNKAKGARSGPGKLAAMTKQTTYKATRALKIEKEASKEDREAVRAGSKTAKEVAAALPPIAPPKEDTKPKAKKIDHPFKPTTPLQHDLLAGWVRLRDNKVAVSERADARDVMRAILKAEEVAEQRAATSGKGGGQ
jgi:hypothetical protein